MSREMEEFLPRQGDKLFQASPSAAHLDPLGFSDPSTPKERSLTGRWSLYSRGFLLAGDRLVDCMTGVPVEDTLVYPILSLYRHHLELELKGLVHFCLKGLSVYKPQKIQEELKKLQREHSLRKLWHTLQTCYPGCDKYRSDNSWEAFEQLLWELDGVDPNSQASRYPVDTKSKQTLLELRYLDFNVLKIGIHKMSHYLNTLHEGICQEADSHLTAIDEEQMLL